MYVYEAHFSPSSIGLLEDLQATITRLLKGHSRPVTHLHCTVWFHGDIERLAKSLISSRVQFNEDQLRRVYRASLEAFPLRSFENKAKPTRLAWYGPHKTVLALDIQVSDSLYKLQQKGRQNFLRMLEKVGIDADRLVDLQKQPAWSWVFKGNYQPHVSLFKDVSGGIPKLNEINLPSVLQIREIGLVDYNKLLQTNI